MSRLEDLYKALQIKKACGRTKEDPIVKDIKNEIQELSIHVYINGIWCLRYNEPDSHGDMFAPGCFDNSKIEPIIWDHS